MRYIIFNLICGLWLTSFICPVVAQNKADSAYHACLISSIGEIPDLGRETKKITLPEAPQGFVLHLAGSDNQQVVDHKGNIHTPLVNTTVNLYLQLIGNGLKEPLDIAGKKVTVPGKYNDNGVNPKPDIIPSLREWYGYSGQFELKKNAAIVINPDDKSVLLKAAEIFQNDLLVLSGFKPAIKSGKPKAGDVYLTLQNEHSELGKEGYFLTIDSYVTISALQYKGLFWGTRTLLQMLERDAQHAFLPKGITRDYPKYEIRGFMLDAGRKFFTMSFLRDYVKLMSYYKMSDFQIHLSDNGFPGQFNHNWDSTYSAFRLENEIYPNLTAKDGFYTKKEFIELQRLAADYAVDIIPELDVPAHCLAYSHAIPEIGSKEYGPDHLDLNNPLTYEVIENVYREYLQGPNPVFISKAMHIGTDEYNKKEAEPFRAFTDHFIRYVQGLGKEVRIWGSLTHARGNTPVTSENVLMNAWYNGYADPVEMKKLGYKLISTPDGYLYIVPAAGYYYDYLNLSMLYNRWEPINVGRVAFAPGDSVIAGGMFAVWNDVVGNGITMKDVNDRVFPAIQVLSQKMWAGKEENISYEQFSETCKQTGEGPGLNIRGKLLANDRHLVVKYSFEKSEKTQVNAKNVAGRQGNALWLAGGKSYVTLPFVEAGYDYTVSFWINAGKNAPGAVLFGSPNAVVKITDNGKLGFMRENYTDDFDYILPEGKWTHIAIAGTAKGTALYVNGALYKKLYDGQKFYAGKEKPKRKMQTLFFPLQTIGDTQNAFIGGIDEFEIFNTVLNDDEIKKLAE